MTFLLLKSKTASTFLSAQLISAREPCFKSLPRQKQVISGHYTAFPLSQETLLYVKEALLGCEPRKCHLIMCPLAIRVTENGK